MLQKIASRPTYDVEILRGVRSVSRIAWDVGEPGAAESWDYLAVCETAGGETRALLVSDAHGLVAAAELFEISYPLDTPLQGRLAILGRILRRVAGPLMTWRVLVVGSPLTERARLVFRPGLDASEKDTAFAALMAGLETEAKRVGAIAAGFKDLDADDAERFGPAMAERGYAAIRSLPVATLDLAGAPSAEAYLARLSSATRKDVRRKLKNREWLPVEHRSSVADCIDDIKALYEETRATSEVRYGDFEELPPDYFLCVGALDPERVRYVLYWADETLVAFNLLLIGADRVIDKFIGMRQPLARAHNLYAVSWMENVRLTIELGRRWLQTGQTAYAEKLRLGSALEPRMIYARHRVSLLNAGLRLAAETLAFDRWDPDLRKLSQPAAPKRLRLPKLPGWGRNAA